MKNILTYIIILILIIPISSFAQQIDSAYYKLPYRDSTINASGNNGYIDTFSVSNAHFRLIHEDTLYNAIVEKNINGKWIRCFDEFYMRKNVDDYTLEDINNDGYSDFVHWGKWGGGVYFFNPATNNFIDTLSWGGVSFDCTLIDTINNVYCDFWEGKQLAGAIRTTLYTYKKGASIGFERIELYEAELNNWKDNSLVTGLILYKLRDNTYSSLYPRKEEIQRIKFAKPINLNEVEANYFNYVKYWKDKYKSLFFYRCRYLPTEK